MNGDRRPSCKGCVLLLVGPWLYRFNTTTRYLAVQERVVFDEAKLLCESYNSTLVSVGTEEEHNYLITLIHE